MGLALQEALGELEEYEQISPSVKSAVLRKFDETICDKLENEVDSSLTVKAERLWSFRLGLPLTGVYRIPLFPVQVL